MIGGQTRTLPINQSLDWSIINLGTTSGAITLLAGTAHITVGSMVVAIGTSAQFRTRLPAANTVLAYRLS